jgi:hypothetical protein
VLRPPHQRVVAIKEEAGGIRVHWKDSSASRATRQKTEDLFHIVIFATGFGEEIVCKGADSLGYWCCEDGDLALDLRIAALAENAQITVGGTGDGGLIDALRAACGTHFRGGALCVDLIKELDDQDFVKQKITDAESRLQAHWLNADATKRNLFSSDLSTSYKAAMRSVLPIFEAFMKFDNEGKNIGVTLCGEFETPYTSMSAPIHKLMLAYSEEKQRITYKQARVHSYSRAKRLLTVELPEATKLFAPEVAARARAELPSVLHISRQGNRPPLAEIFSSEDAQLLRLQQSHVGNYVFSGLYDAEFFATDRDFNGKVIERFGPTSKPYVESRKQKVEELLKPHLNVANIKTEPVDDTKAKWRFVLLKNEEDDPTETKFKKFMRGNGPPYRLYSVDIVTRVADEHPEETPEL